MDIQATHVMWSATAYGEERLFTSCRQMSIIYLYLHMQYIEHTGI